MYLCCCLTVGKLLYCFQIIFDEVSSNLFFGCTENFLITCLFDLYIRRYFGAASEINVSFSCQIQAKTVPVSWGLFFSRLFCWICEINIFIEKCNIEFDTCLVFYGLSIIRWKMNINIFSPVQNLKKYIHKNGKLSVELESSKWYCFLESWRLLALYINFIYYVDQ